MNNMIHTAKDMLILFLVVGFILSFGLFSVLQVPSNLDLESFRIIQQVSESVVKLATLAPVKSSHEFQFNSSKLTLSEQNEESNITISVIPDSGLQTSSPSPVDLTQELKLNSNNQSYLVVIATTEEAETIIVTKVNYF